jgi:hypothetical protein
MERDAHETGGSVKDGRLAGARATDGRDALGHKHALLLAQQPARHVGWGGPTAPPARPLRTVSCALPSRLLSSSTCLSRSPSAATPAAPSHSPEADDEVAAPVDERVSSAKRT